MSFIKSNNVVRKQSSFVQLPPRGKWLPVIARVMVRFSTTIMKPDETVPHHLDLNSSYFTNISQNIDHHWELHSPVLKHFWQSSEPWPFLTHHSFRSEPIVQSPEEHYSMGWQDYCWHFIKFPSHALMTVSPYSLGLNSSWYTPLSKHAPIKTCVFILKRSTILLSVCSTWNWLFL